MKNNKFIAARARQISDSGGFDIENADPVASPCVNICRMTPDSSHCTGCFRSLGEIRAWSSADSAQRRHIWAQALGRAGIALPPDLQS